jgi:hypothetical protein
MTVNERSFVIEKTNSVKKKFWPYAERKVKDIKPLPEIVQGAETSPPEHILITSTNA